MSGRSIQDNSEKVPSVLVSELLEYCQQGYCLAGDEALPVDESANRLGGEPHPNVTRWCRLARRRFSGGRHSYAAEWLPVANQAFIEPEMFQSSPLEPDLSDDRAEGILELAELSRFWRLPVQYFFNRRLKVFFDGQQGGPEDDEPFALDGLGRLPVA